MARTLNPTLVASELPSYEFLIVSEKSWFYVPFLSPGGPLQGPYRGASLHMHHMRSAGRLANEFPKNS